MERASCPPLWGAPGECIILYETYLDLYSYCYDPGCGPAFLTWVDCQRKAEGPVCRNYGDPDPCPDEAEAMDEICGFDEGTGGTGGSSPLCRVPDKPVDPIISNFCLEAVACGSYDSQGYCIILYDYDLDVYSYCGGDPCGDAFLSYIDCFAQLPDPCNYDEDDCQDEVDALNEICGFDEGTGGTGGSSGLCR